MKTKKKNKAWLFWFIIIIFFICYCGLSVALSSGYYESKMKQRTTMTEEMIEKFEADIKEGKYVDVNDYLVEDKDDYINGVSKLGLSFSNGMEKFMTDGISNVLKVFGKLFGS